MGDEASQVIWKFELPVEDNIVVRMPDGAQIISVDVQREIPCLWAIVDPAAALVDRNFVLRGTGHELGIVGGHVGSFLLYSGAIVFHLFEAA